MIVGCIGKSTFERHRPHLLDRAGVLMATETEVHEILEGTGALDPQRQREARQVAQQLRAVTEAQPPGSGALVALVDNLIETADLFDEVGQ